MSTSRGSTGRAADAPGRRGRLHPAVLRDRPAPQYALAAGRELPVAGRPGSPPPQPAAPTPAGWVDPRLVVAAGGGGSSVGAVAPAPALVALAPRSAPVVRAAGSGGAGGLTGGGGAGSSYAPAASGASAGPAATTATPEVVISYTQPVTTMTGRAFGVRSTGLVTVAATPDTGQISTANASRTFPCADARHIRAGLDGRGLCAGVVTTPAGTSTSASSTANAGVKWLVVAAKGLPPVRLGWVRADSRTTCSGSSGRSSIGYLMVGSYPVAVSSPRPGTIVHRGGLTLVLNEQIPVPGGLTVNAVHLEAPGLDTVIASATSDIHSCHS
ncbi:hypothetical protein GXW82_12515 [Streptacidiphilus sp. 4-A2]|nr:hypothetical protein [Streptacidiphilus sp. 4-A2]